MRSNVARKLGTLEKQSSSLTLIRSIPPRSSTWEEKEKGARKTLVNERIEEAVGVGFIVAAFFLTGWFYYSLYQALQH